MKRNFPLYLLLFFFAASVVVSCNDDKDEVITLDDVSKNALMVNSFSLKANDSILSNLDSVFFSIDLDRAMVFNADSLPKGTRVDRLVVDMTLSAVKKAEITMPGKNGKDTVVNYLVNSTDSIDFSRGSVKLHLESANGEYTRDYTLYVNVHKVDPDMMVWTDLASAKLPSSLSSPEAQRTVELGTDILCFTVASGNCSRAIADDPTGPWTYASVSLPASAKLETLTACGTDLYLVAGNDQLYKSSDKGESWSATGTSMSYIYGAMESRIVGVVASGSEYKSITYPASVESVLESSAPVSATSQAVVFTSEWSAGAMMIVAGGKDRNGNLVAGAWAYDGNSWANLSSSNLPGLESPVLVPYFAFKTSDAWRTTRYSVLLAFGGIDANATNSRSLYISYDMGVHWALASEQMQLPANYAPGAYAQAVVFDRTFSVDHPAGGSLRWTDGPSIALPRWYEVAEYDASSRASEPIQSWECPYIYLFGGMNPAGALNDKIRRGVLNRLTFKPLQ